MHPTRMRRRRHSHSYDQAWRRDFDSEDWSRKAPDDADQSRSYRIDDWYGSTSDPYVSDASTSDFSSYRYRGYRHSHYYDPDHYYSAAYQRPYPSDDNREWEDSSSFVPTRGRSTNKRKTPPSPDRSVSYDPSIMHRSTSSSGQLKDVIPKTPLASYLQVSLRPSLPLQPLPPSALRKLLILDLNGTLLVRSPRSHPQRNPAHFAETKTSDRNNATRVRHVYPRPFMPAFRAYLFAPSTLSWLDTMIWSSAQPHSVNDMIDKCFGNEKGKLVAVWARDTLGLDHGEYHRKTQSTKDLAKPWSALTLRPPAHAEHEFGHKNFTQEPQAHSAHTTILLDDSPLKAQLQPWNHLCIREYVRKMRMDDLEVLQNEKLKEWEVHVPLERDDPEARASTSEQKKDRKGKHTSTSAAQLPQSSEEECRYDETLLAVIGILEAIKDESNVAGWIRAGGLWGTGNHDESVVVAGNDVAQFRGTPPSTPASSSKDDPPMWFENHEAMEHWVTRGRNGLLALGIEIDAGIKA